MTKTAFNKSLQVCLESGAGASPGHMLQEDGHTLPLENQPYSYTWAISPEPIISQ